MEILDTLECQYGHMRAYIIVSPEPTRLPAAPRPNSRSGVCQASCPISYAANTTFLAKSLLSFDGFNQTSLTGFQLRTERFFQRSGLASLAVS